MENDENSRFWEDVWIGSSPLAYLFADPYGRLVKKNSSVASRWSKRHQMWRLKFFGPWTRLEALLQILDIGCDGLEAHF
ncbi:hypothetical protein COCNU_08G010650 [Cocos nucifera]|uniref:Uncharacterized protein n=1 Tax=Cocos nucifera TaxID=13894 RepID=A0A8K0II96_COCNU|nr:hypothetical protein COCNU_08G010650 [Cocos nucifera]